jgi:3-(3-hydroxy-phenyl)propionate hydroxylase
VTAGTGPAAPAPVLVAGAGPVGLTAALALRSYGLPATVLEAEPQDRARPGSRALFVHGSSLDLLDVASPGLAGELIRHGVVWRTRRTTYRGRQVYARTYPPPAPGQRPPFISLRQVETERHLLAAAKQAGVEIEWGTPVSDVTAGPDQVTVHAGARPWAAQYVIAADGARSAVRPGAGIELHGDRAAGFHVVVDIGDSDGPPERLERVFHYEHPALDGRNVLLVPFAGGFQVDLQCRDGDDPDQFATGEGVRRWLPRVIPERYLTSIMWVAKYHYLQVIADAFTDPRRRILLAGEAAHLFPPLGARGMNSGMADADAAATAVTTALAAANPARAAQAIERFGADRRAAARYNSDSVGRALAHLRPDTALGRLRLRSAGLAAPAVPALGSWLEHAAYGPRSGPPTLAHGKY